MDCIESEITQKALDLIKKYRNYSIYQSIHYDNKEEIQKDNTGTYYPKDFFTLYEILVSFIHLNKEEELIILLNNLFIEDETYTYNYMAERLQTFILNNDNSSFVSLIMFKTPKISNKIQNVLYKIDHVNVLNIIYTAIKIKNQMILKSMMTNLVKISSNYYINNRHIELLDLCFKYNNVEAFNQLLTYAKINHISLYELSSNLYNEELSIFNFIFKNENKEFLTCILNYNKDKSINNQLLHYLYRNGDFSHCLLLRKYKILKNANSTIFKIACHWKNKNIINTMWFDKNIDFKRSPSIKKMALPYLNQAQIIIELIDS